MSRILAAVLWVVPSFAFAWGFNGHRMLAKHMQDPLPANLCLRQWYAAHQSFDWQDHACDPDRWRMNGTPDHPFDPNEAPRHFLEIDWAQPVSSYPRDFAQAQVQFGQYATRNGQVPWRVEVMYQQLVTAFRSGDQNQILLQSFWLSHYVTDSYSLLHDTQYFDPNNGLHSRWESDMLSKTANINAIQDLAASMYGTPGIGDPKNNTFDSVIVGVGVLPRLVAADALASGDGGVYDPNTYQLQVLFDQTKDFTARRWADADTVLASLLWTAWAEAGSPELLGADGGFSSSCSRASPSGETVILGFPIPGGFTHPDGGIILPPHDAGVPPVNGVDSGVADAGPDPVVDDAGSFDAGQGSGGGRGGGSGGGGGGEEMPPVGCGCSSLDASMVVFGALALALRRRRP